MTLAEIRQTVRDVLKEAETDAGTLLPTGNLLLDRFINWGTEEVVLDLVPHMQEVFLTSENISLVANQSDYDLTAEWIRIWCIVKNVSGSSPRPIRYIDRDDIAYKMYVGQTAEHPARFTLTGDSITFVPTPSTAKTNYATAWVIATEVASMVATGPAYIPRMAHKLIPLKTVILISKMNEYDLSGAVALYSMLLDRVIENYAYRIQGEPRFLKSSALEKSVISSLDPALHDVASLYFFN